MSLPTHSAAIINRVFHGPGLVLGTLKNCRFGPGKPKQPGALVSLAVPCLGPRCFPPQACSQFFLCGKLTPESECSHSGYNHLLFNSPPLLFPAQLCLNYICSWIALIRVSMVTSHFLEEKLEPAGSVALPSLSSREESVLRMSVTCFEPVFHLSDQFYWNVYDPPGLFSRDFFFFQDQK